MRNHHYHSVYTGESEVSPLWIMIFFVFLFMLPGTTGTLGVMKIYQLNENHQGDQRVIKTTTASRLANNHRDRPKSKVQAPPNNTSFRNSINTS
uniref:Uncharacterized protein n=1 Tax=Klebsiella pneumoniae TaxID=573 RepID=A0A8B0SRH0_KLEPN|nr:hypothetical protein [Klebsiella pneumoniae]